jgi:hypothetical protein
LSLPPEDRLASPTTEYLVLPDYDLARTLADQPRLGRADVSDQMKREPVAEVLRGLHIHPLPAGWTALEGIVLLKCLDADGNSSWAFRTTDGLNDEELLGALTVRIDLLRRELLESYSSDDETDER